MIKKSNKQAGFTIIEIMIATAVLSMILLLVTTMMIGISNLYYKGINQSRIQDNARGVSDEISQKLQLSDTPFTLVNSLDNGTHALCIGPTRYSFVLNKQIGGGAGQSAHVLWRDTVASGVCTVGNGFLNAGMPSPGGVELMAPNSLLTAFTVLGTPPTGGSPYTITIGEAYGDATDATLMTLNGTRTQCLADGGGDQFCATAYLVTTVAQRKS